MVNEERGEGYKGALEKQDTLTGVLFFRLPTLSSPEVLTANHEQYTRVWFVKEAFIKYTFSAVLEAILDLQFHSTIVKYEEDFKLHTWTVVSFFRKGTEFWI